MSIQSLASILTRGVMAGSKVALKCMHLLSITVAVPYAACIKQKTNAFISQGPSDIYKRPKYRE